jgi:hypothetical protein
LLLWKYLFETLALESFMRFCFLVAVLRPLAALSSLPASTCLCLIATISVSASVTASAQTVPRVAPSQVVQRDAASIAFISKALNSMGGPAPYVAVKDTNTSATCVVSKSNNETHNVRWVTAGNYFRYDGGESDRRGIVNGGGGAHRVTNGKSVPIEGRVTYAMQPFHLPGLLLMKALTDPSFELQSLSSATSSTPGIHVRIRDTAETEYPEISTQDWYFDPSTGLPLRVEYQMPTTSDTFRAALASVEYSDYRSQGGIVVPNTLRRSLEGGPTSTCHVTSFVRDSSPPDTLFSSDSGGAQ